MIVEKSRKTGSLQFIPQFIPERAGANTSAEYPKVAPSLASGVNQEVTRPEDDFP